MTAYNQKVLNTSPVGYWMLDEASGADALDSSGNDFDGVYANVTLGQTGIGDGRTCPYFNGTNAFVDIFGAGFAAAFGTTVGSMMIWSKVETGVWADGAYRPQLSFYQDTNNRLHIYKGTTNNTQAWLYDANATMETNADTAAPSGWSCLLMTWTDPGDIVAYYRDGASAGANDTGIGTWAGTLTTAHIGFWSITSAYFKGWLAHATHWDKVLSSEEITSLATIDPLGNPWYAYAQQ